MSAATSTRIRRRPLGFLALGLLLAYAAAMRAFGLLVAPLPPELGGIAQRALYLVITVLLAVAAEALLRCRPWAYRAASALATGIFASLVIDAAVSGRLGFFEGIVILPLTGLVLWVPLAYVKDRTQRLYGPPQSVFRRP